MVDVEEEPSAELRRRWQITSETEEWIKKGEKWTRRELCAITSPVGDARGERIDSLEALVEADLKDIGDSDVDCNELYPEEMRVRAKQL